MRMVNTKLFRSSVVFRWALLSAALFVPQVAQAQVEWHATVGAQNQGMGFQVLAFLPNEIWINAGDSITWTFNVDEIHTVTFLKARQVRPPFSAGCPGFATDPASFDGSECVTTPPLASGATFTVNFPKAGNYKLVCLVHENMTATVHVFPAGHALPHTQRFYDTEATDRKADLLATGTAVGKTGVSNDHAVTAGIGAVAATPGGTDTVSVLRFLHENITIHAGETIQWANRDPVTPHTITFGEEPPDDALFAPSDDVTLDADGARHATLNAPGESTHSGFIRAEPQERTGLRQTPPRDIVTRFRITFTQPGTYPYICSLHDELGMEGTVTVIP